MLSPNRNSLLRWYGCFTVIVCISIFLTNTNSFKEMLASCVVYALAWIGLIGSYDYARLYGEKQHTYVLVFIVMCCILSAYYIVYSSYNILGEKGHFGVAYYILYPLPLMLASQKKMVRYLSVIAASCVIISSVKRGGLLALLLGLIVYAAIQYHITPKKNKNIFITIISLVCLGILFYFAIIKFGGDIINRFIFSEDTTGSGRTLIWESIITRLKNQDISKWITGNGYLATMEGTMGDRDGFSAHNDFLEILYDHGIVTLICYIGFLISWALYCLTAIKQRSPYAASLSMMFTIYFILSMLSIVVLYYASLLSMITLGTLIGWNEYTQHCNFV